MREATIEDIPKLIEICTRMHEESPVYKTFPIDSAKLEYLLTVSIESGDALVAVAEKDEQVIGLFWGLVTEAFFSRVRIAQDFLLYILPEYRRGLTASRLVKYYEQWSIERGAARIHLGVSAGIADEAVGRLYQRLGFEPTSVGYSKEG